MRMPVAAKHHEKGKSACDFRSLSSLVQLDLEEAIDTDWLQTILVDDSADSLHKPVSPSTTVCSLSWLKSISSIYRWVDTPI